MYANHQSNRLNTIAVRASYISPILRKEKPGGSHLPPEKTKTETSLSV